MSSVSMNLHKVVSIKIENDNLLDDTDTTDITITQADGSVLSLVLFHDIGKLGLPDFNTGNGLVEELRTSRPLGDSNITMSKRMLDRIIKALGGKA